MPPVPPPAVVRGPSPIVLVAPHAGRRDAARRPWGSGPLKMNDLHTGSLARELGRRLGASAVINDGGDRNDVDLNRLTAAHDRAPHFLEALADLVDEAIARHGRAIVLTVHGWNVVQPAVDLGLGTAPRGEPLGIGPGAAVSDAFAATTLRSLARALAARDIAATPGLRYPARARENLLQLFTGRYADDPRPLVRRLAAAGARTDAVQLELALPLRLPGPWRDRFVDACVEALDDRPTADERRPPGWPGATPAATARRALEFVAEDVCGLAALDESGGRLLLLPSDGTLVVFTGERVGTHGPGRVAGLELTEADGALTLAYEGPLLLFPDTTPFLDLERGLAAATIGEGRVRLHLEPSHRDPAGEPCPFGTVRGRIAVGGRVRDVTGHGVRAARGDLRSPRPRAAFRLGDGRGVLVAGVEHAFLCRGHEHARFTRIAIDADGEPPSSIRVRGETSDGEHVAVDAVAALRLPVVTGGTPPARLLFAACRAPYGLAGWAELRGR